MNIQIKSVKISNYFYCKKDINLFVYMEFYLYLCSVLINKDKKMKASNIQFVRSNEVNDIFSYIDENNDLQYINFPRTMGMSTNDVFEHLND